MTKIDALGFSIVNNHLSDIILDDEFNYMALARRNQNPVVGEKYSNTMYLGDTKGSTVKDLIKELIFDEAVCDPLNYTNSCGVITESRLIEDIGSFKIFAIRSQVNNPYGEYDLNIKVIVPQGFDVF